MKTKDLAEILRGVSQAKNAMDNFLTASNDAAAALEDVDKETAKQGRAAITHVLADVTRQINDAREELVEIKADNTNAPKPEGAQ